MSRILFRGGSPDTQPGGRLGGLARGWSPGPHPGERFGGSVGLRLISRGEVGGSGQGGLQAHTWGGVQAQAQGISQHALRLNPPPQQMATAAGGTHPTGMHSWKLELITANGKDTVDK